MVEATLVGKIYYTLDSGFTWGSKTLLFGIRSMCSSVSGLVAVTTNLDGTDCNIQRSTDGGAIWAVVYDLSAQNFSIISPDIRHKAGVLVYSDDGINTEFSDYMRYLISIDDGVTWTLATTNIPLS